MVVTRALLCWGLREGGARGGPAERYLRATTTTKKPQCKQNPRAGRLRARLPSKIKCTNFYLWYNTKGEVEALSSCSLPSPAPPPHVPWEGCCEATTEHNEREASDNAERRQRQRERRKKSIFYYWNCWSCLSFLLFVSMPSLQQGAVSSVAVPSLPCIS